MNECWILILVLFFAINSLDKAKSVQLEEIDEIFGEGWWDNDKAEEWHKLTLEQTFHHQIDRQDTQIGQIEPNSTDQNPPLTESDHSGQIEPNSTDQNPLLTADHSDNAKNGDEQKGITLNENIAEDERKHKIVDKFHLMRDEFKEKGKHSEKWSQIENKIAKHLKVSRKKIYEWKKEFGLSQKRKMHNIEEKKDKRKHLVEKFDQRKAETTIYAWKQKLGQSKPNKYSHSEQKEMVKHYHEIMDKNPKISVGDIAKMLKIGTSTLYKWKKQFERQQMHSNSVNGHSVEENARQMFRKL